MRHAKPLLLTVLLALVIGVALPAGVARAESYPGDSLDNPYLLDASQTVENPFPDKISDEDIATMSKQGPLLSDRVIRKLEVELTDGERILLPTNFEGGTVTTPGSVIPHDFVQEHEGRIRSITTYYVFPASEDHESTVCLGTWAYSAYLQGRVSGDPDNHVVRAAPRTRVLHNGQEMDPKLNYFSFKTIPTTQYFETTTEFPEDAKISNIYTLDLHGVRRSFKYGYERVGVRIYMHRTYLFPTATFHFVDEAAYRGLTGQPSGAVAKRSDGEPVFSVGPFTRLDLTDLAPTLTTSDFYDDSGAIDTEPMLNPEGGTARSRYWDPKGAVPKGDVKPTYAQLTATEIPGYVYVDDDIDQPTGAGDLDNATLDPAIVDGNWKYDKDYYLLYRPLPVPVTVRKVDAESGSGVGGASFSLYAVRDGKEVLVRSGLMSDGEGRVSGLVGADGKTYDDLVAIAKGDAYDPATGAYAVGESLYLTPGDYVLREDIAPRGYDRADDLAFTVQPLPFTTSGEGEAVTHELGELPSYTVSEQRSRAVRVVIHYIDVTGSGKGSGHVPADGTELAEHVQNHDAVPGGSFDNELWDYASAGYRLVEKDDGADGDTLPPDAPDVTHYYVYLTREKDVVPPEPPAGGGGKTTTPGTKEAAGRPARPAVPDTGDASTAAHLAPLALFVGAAAVCGSWLMWHTSSKKNWD